MASQENHSEDDRSEEVSLEDQISEEGNEDSGDHDTDSEEYDEEEFPFLRLPRELQIAVFSEIPDLWTLISFRQTSHEINNIYLSEKSRIIPAVIDSIVQPFRSYYDFHASLHIPSSSIVHPPRGGWPHLTPENCQNFNKTPLAIEVLRRLPYIRGESQSDFTNVGFKCNVIDYSIWTPGEDYPGELAEMVHDDEGNPHKIAIFDGYESFGVAVIFDTMKNTLYEEFIRASVGREDMDPAEFFNEEMQKYRECRDIFVPGKELLWGDENTPGYDAEAMERQGPPNLDEREYGDDRLADYQWVRHLYRKFGWPPEEGEGWRKEECMRAIREYAEVGEDEH